MNAYAEYTEFMKYHFDKLPKWLDLKPGMLIHLTNKNGMYIVHHVSKHKICITCKRWMNEWQRGDRTEYYEYVPNVFYKCRAGGKNYFMRNIIW